MKARKQASMLPNLNAKQIRKLFERSTTQDIIYDTIEVANTITDILLGAMVEPGRDREHWTRRQIRERMHGGTIKRLRTLEILRNAQLKPSAFEWLRYYFNKLLLTRSEDGRHFHDGQLVDVDYELEVEANI